MMMMMNKKFYFLVPKSQNYVILTSQILLPYSEIIPLLPETSRKRVVGGGGDPGPS